MMHEGESINNTHKDKIWILTDFFDTLVHRTVKEEEISSIWAQDVSERLDGTISASKLIRARKLATIMLARKGRTEELKYEDIMSKIYSFFRRKISLSAEKFVELCLAEETRVEMEHLYLDEEMVSFLREQYKNGKRIAIVSDFYMSQEQLLYFVEKLGIADIISRIFVSCDYGVKKKSGNLYRIVIKELGEPCDLIMYGDNETADYHAALKNGIDSHLREWPRKSLTEESDLIHDTGNGQTPAKKRPSSIGANVIWNGILSLSSILFPIITFPYITRVLGVETNGAISFSSSVVNYFALFANLGLSTYGVKACAQVKDDKNKLSQVTHELLLISSLAAVVVLTVLYLSLLFIPQFQNYIALMTVYSMNILFNVLGMNWMYQGIEKFKYITARSIIFKLISVIIMFLFVKDIEDGMIYACISVFAAGAGNILNAVNSHKYIRYNRYSHYDIKRHVKPILFLFATALAVNIYSSLDTVMLGWLQGDYATGIYSVAVKVKTILLTLISSFSIVMMSRLSYVEKSGNDIFKLLKKSYGLTIFMTAPICIYFILLSSESVLFLSGSSFSEASMPMKILMPTIVISSVSQVIGSQYSVSVGKEKNLMIAVVTGAFVNIIFNAILIPKLSYNGAAIGTVIAEVTQCIIQFVLAKEMVRKTFSLHDFIKVCIGATTALIITMTFRRYIIIEGSFMTLLSNAIIFFTVYFGVMILLKYEICNNFISLLKTKILSPANKCQ